jgi:2-keto-myo-inositol isomerase
MPQFAINHMTVPRLGYLELFALAQELGCVGVELRNDLAQPLFDGDAPEQVARAAGDHGLRIVGLSQVYPFNAWSDGVRDEVKSLIAGARGCGAETISLIPRNDGRDTANGVRQDNARRALAEIRPMLDDADMVALVEPLGFPVSSLRFKAETLKLIDEVGGQSRFKLVHDTFHHFLAGETEFFPDQTGIVHISGVVDPALTAEEMLDGHRILVDGNDRLGNLEQIETLARGGYRGPISIESFAKSVHDLPNAGPELARMFDHIKSRVGADLA